jgi:hypothetical protein
MTRCIEDTYAASASDRIRNIGAETPIGQSQVENREFGPVMLAEFDRPFDSASYAADLVAAGNQSRFQHLCHHEVIFGNQDLRHRQRLFP